MIYRHCMDGYRDRGCNTMDPQAQQQHRRSTRIHLQSSPRRSISLLERPLHLPPWHISDNILEYAEQSTKLCYIQDKCSNPIPKMQEISLKCHNMDVTT